MPAQTATVTCEGDDTIIRISGRVRLPQGPILIREDKHTGELILAPVEPRPVEGSWAQLFAEFDALPRDEHWDEFIKVMQERPMNRLPVERDLFPGE